MSIFDFVLGVAVGSSTTGSSKPITGRAIAVALLVIFALVGAGYAVIEAVWSSGRQQCGGGSMAAVGFCNLLGMAGKLSVMFLTLAVIAAAVVGCSSWLVKRNQE